MCMATMPMFFCRSCHSPLPDSAVYGSGTTNIIIMRRRRREVVIVIVTCLGMSVCLDKLTLCLCSGEVNCEVHWWGVWFATTGFKESGVVVGSDDER